MKNLPNILAISFKSILKNKRRNIFTMIGIIIGIAAVITIMSLGNGFKQTAADEFSDSGAGKNSAIISFMTSNGEGAKDNPFSQQDIDVVKQVNTIHKLPINNYHDLPPRTGTFKSNQQSNYVYAQEVSTSNKLD